MIIIACLPSSVKKGRYNNMTTYEIAPGVSFPVECWIDKEGNTSFKPQKRSIPLVAVPLMTNFQEHTAALLHRIARPENYAPHEDIAATVEKLKHLLRENINHINELRPEQQVALLEILKNESALLA